MRPTVFFVIATTLRIDFILRTDIFRKLKNLNYRIVIITKFYADKKFTDEFGGENIIFEQLKKVKKSFINFDNLRSRALEIKTPELNFAKKVFFNITEGYRNQSTVVTAMKAILSHIILLIISPLKTSLNFWEFLENIFIKSKAHEELFERYNPDAVVLASNGGDRNDSLFLVYGKRNNAACFIVDTNIDAFEFRYFSYTRRGARWMLFGEPEKQHAMKIQKINKKDIMVTGPARYDAFLDKNKWLKNREEFFKEIGADPNKKLITFGAKTPFIFPHNRKVIDEIISGIQKNEFGPAQLLVRLDPNNDPNQYSDLSKDIILETMDNQGSRVHVANLLYHSDVVISAWSTISIEACVVGTPAIWISFDEQNKPWIKSYNRTYEIGVFSDILKTGAISLAKNEKSLRSLIREYLSDKRKNQKERVEFLKSWYMGPDGKAGERIADEIIKTLSSKNS